MDARKSLVGPHDDGAMEGETLVASPLAELDVLLMQLIEKHPNRNVVALTAAWIAAHALEPWTVYIQIKLRTWISGDRARTFNNKLMLFYVIHEFLKTPTPPAERKARQHAWTGTVEHIFLTCIRDMDESRKVEENKKKLFKTLGRWEELGIFRAKLRDWRRFITGEARPRKPPQKMLLPGAMDPFDRDGMNLQMSVHRLNLPSLMEVQYASLSDKKRHWRFTGVAFIDALSHALGLPPHIVVTAMHYFHTLFDKGFYARERYKIAAACLFLAAKASSQRMRLLRMVHVMHYILETPLQYGDEEKEELERMHLLHYELQVLRGVSYDLTIDLPYCHLYQLVSKLPPSCSSEVGDVSKVILRELFWTTMCIDYSAVHLAQASIVIACHIKQTRCESAWLSDKQHAAMVPLQRTTMLEQYMQLHAWKTQQTRLFQAATATDEQKRHFLVTQKGGLTWPVHDSISLPSEMTNQVESRPPPRSPPKNRTRSPIKDRARSPDRRHRSPSKDYRKPRSPAKDRRPRKRSSSPRKRSSSPRKRSSSPRKRSSSPRKRSPSPRKRSRSPSYRKSSYHTKRYSRSRSPDRGSRYYASRRRSPSYDRRSRRRKDDYESDYSSSSSDDDDRYRRRSSTKKHKSRR
ncbi:hypothetical protein SDRG_16369 [Saprolegnia diclina VS20]|uniref:Cyclin N-terminal domain-containing protein n=1 Tax=Saprolegnia diclina (strain VS20) TaxID=1156394 RepID=T0R195_SAPDV|nr:hypothetical protein SDRG_16369 [Saprolegnia diclina VS20]EQC25773.1 hypothetical protein SDRG_16369 [Saprolegnia diclina VS20]|eukprot:XP_008620798.1 hypothetical protein SDRG_16369 [Saprolegnia diclina VS20]